MLCGCGRFDFATLTDANGDGLGDGATNAACIAMGALYCDDFERTMPIVHDDPGVGRRSLCDGGNSLTVGGTLDLAYPAFDGNGDTACSLLSLPGPISRTLQIDFDVTLTPDSMAQNIGIAEIGVDLGAPNAAGIQQEAASCCWSTAWAPPRSRASTTIPTRSLSPRTTTDAGYDVAG